MSRLSMDRNVSADIPHRPIGKLITGSEDDKFDGLRERHALHDMHTIEEDHILTALVPETKDMSIQRQVHREGNAG
jgi:hypothetical protein